MEVSSGVLFIGLMIFYLVRTVLLLGDWKKPTYKIDLRKLKRLRERVEYY